MTVTEFEHLIAELCPDGVCAFACEHLEELYDEFSSWHQNEFLNRHR
jgi:hypothetical protein